MDHINWHDEMLRRMIEDYESMKRSEYSDELAYSEAIHRSIAGQGVIKDFNRWVETSSVCH